MKSYLSSLAWVERQQNETIELIKKWTSINSWSENIPGLHTLLEVLKKDFEILKGEMKELSLPSRKVVNSQGHLIEQTLGKALLIKKRPLAPIQIFFGGHMDTVYPPFKESQSIRIENEKFYGPGVADMKGGLAILLKIVQALEDSPFSQNVGWEILINPDEEIGSIGSYQHLIQAAKNNHLGLIFEPSLEDGAFINQRKGSANFTLVVKGKASHAGRDFFKGKSAIAALAEIINKMETINDQQKNITLNFGHIEGGGPVNIVPELAICKINLRAEDIKQMLQAKEELYAIVKEKKRESIDYSLIEETFRLPKPNNAKTHSLFLSYQTCAKDLDIPFVLKSSGGTCDGNILSAAGLSTLDSLGVVGANIHTSEEYFLLSSLCERMKLALLFILKIANKEILIT